MRHPDDGLIEEYLDDELAADARAELEAHTAECAACGDRLDLARATRGEADGLVALLGEPAPRPGATELPPSLTRAPRRRLPWRTLAWAASVVAAVGVGYAGGRGDGRKGGQADGRTVGQADSPTVGQAERPERTAESGAGPVARPANPSAEPPSRRAAEPPSPRAAAPPSPRAAEPRAEEALIQAGPPAAEFRADDLEDRAMQKAARAPTLADAVRALGGSIRLLDGLDIGRVSVQWLPMPGGDSAAVVELTYADAAGHEITLRQSRAPAPGRNELAAAAEARRQVAAARGRELAPAAPAAVPAGDGELAWLDAGGFRLVLRADADADSLARIRARIR